jgi:hypothetical protein
MMDKERLQAAMPFPPFAGMIRIRFGGSRDYPPLSRSNATPR